MQDQVKHLLWLAREYMTLVIANPASYRTILAVTFTNKATEEMKMRILGKLYEIAHGLPEANDYVNQIQQALPYLHPNKFRKMQNQHCICSYIIITISGL